jgi:hypothetical protein
VTTPCLHACQFLLSVHSDISRFLNVETYGTAVGSVPVYSDGLIVMESPM